MLMTLRSICWSRSGEAAVRETPNGAVITSITEGTRVRAVSPYEDRYVVTSQVNPWILVCYDGTNTGWAAKAYLKEAETAPPPEYVSFEREEYTVQLGRQSHSKRWSEGFLRQ